MAINVFSTYYYPVGHYVVSQELKRQSGDDSADRVESMSIVVRDLMHEIRLDEWIDNQGGWVSVCCGFDGCIVSGHMCCVDLMGVYWV